MQKQKISNEHRKSFNMNFVIISVKYVIRTTNHVVSCLCHNIDGVAFTFSYLSQHLYASPYVSKYSLIRIECNRKNKQIDNIYN